MARSDGDRAERAAQRKAAGIAHEDRCGRRIEPQKGKPRPDDRTAHDGQLTRARYIRNTKIFSELDVADEISDQHEGHAGDNHRHRRQPVEPVGQVDRVTEGDDREGGEGIIKQAQVEPRIADKRQIEKMLSVAQDDPCRHSGDQEFEQQAHFCRNAVVARFGHLVVIVHETDRGEAQGDEHSRPDEMALEVHPQQ